MIFQRTESGYTLIEMLITVSIVGILAAVVYPAYTNQVERAGRTEAKTMLLQAHARQESFFGTNNRYAGNMTALGYGNNLLLTENDRYHVSMNASSPNTFVLDAVPNPALPHADDSCGSFVIDHLSVKDIKHQPSTATISARNCWGG